MKYLEQLLSERHSEYSMYYEEYKRLFDMKPRPIYEIINIKKILTKILDEMKDLNQEIRNDI